MQVSSFIPYNSKSTVIGIKVSHISPNVGSIPNLRLDIEELAVETHPTRYGFLKLETYLNTDRIYYYSEELFRYDYYDHEIEFPSPDLNSTTPLPIQSSSSSSLPSSSLILQPDFPDVDRFGIVAVVPIKQFFAQGEFYVTINLTNPITEVRETAEVWFNPSPTYSQAMAAQTNAAHNDSSRTFSLHVEGPEIATSILRLDLYPADESVVWGKLHTNSKRGACHVGTQSDPNPYILTSGHSIIFHLPNPVPIGHAFKISCDNIGLISRDNENVFSGLVFVLGNGTASFPNIAVVNAFVIAESFLAQYEYFALIIFATIVSLLVIYFIILWALRAWNRYQNGGDPYIVLHPEIAALQETHGKKTAATSSAATTSSISSQSHNTINSTLDIESSHSLLDTSHDLFQQDDDELTFVDDAVYQPPPNLTKTDQDIE